MTLPDDVKAAMKAVRDERERRLANTPPASVEPPPTSEESRELFIARHFIALFFTLIAAAVALVAWYFHG